MAKSKLEMFQNGTFSTGEPVYQIGSKNADGEYDIVVFDPMRESEAKAKLKSMGGSASKKDEAVAVTGVSAKGATKPAPKPVKVEEVEETTKAELNQMTKVELEEFARDFGVELDRRERKDTLVKQAYKAQFDG
jgi:hypothetical protein|tara:strand:+ start:468 stop:869 length:402 start_codon:yes stop_codon:yes gene_type:complete